MSENPPNPPVPPVPPGQPGPQSSDAFGRLLRSVSGRDWLAAVLAAVGGWVAAYVVAAISLLLTVAVLAAGGSGSVGSGSTGTGTDLGAGSTPDVQSLLSGVSVLLGTPAQLVALADLGRLHLSGSIGFLGSGSGALAVVPALVLAAQVVLAVVLTRRIRTRGLGRTPVLLTAVLSGLVTTVLTNAAAGILAIRFPAVSGASIDPVHAVGLGSILGAFVIGALAAVLARPSALLGRNVFAGRVLGTLRVAASQLTVLVVLVTVVVIVVALVAQPSWGAALPVLVGNVAVGLTALGFFGGVGLSGFGSAGSTASVFGGAGGWTWLVVLLVLVTSVVAGLALAVRRNDRFRTTLDWVVTPVVWFALGLLLFVLGTGLVSYQATGISAVSGTGSIGIAPWTPLVFALWGGAIEAVARYLAPVLLPRLGGGVVLRTSRLVGADPRPAAAPTFPAATPAFPPAGPAFPPADPAFPSAAPAGDPAAAAWAATPGVGHPGQPDQPFVGGGAPAPAPMSPRAKKVLVRSLIAGGAVVVVVIAGAVTTGVLRANVWGPAPTVKSYVQAIASGDADTAARLSEVPSDAAMLDTAVLKSAKDRPSDIRVGRVSTSGDSALATVSYTQGGKNRSGQVSLRRTGTAFLVKDEWRVTEPLAQTVTLTASEVLEGAPVTVGGKEIGEISDGRFTSLAYPGTYEVQVGGTKYFTGGTEQVSVGATSSGYVDFTPTATKALQQDAEQYVTDLIDDCATKTDLSALSGCPWYGPYDADGAVRYDVTTMPEVEVEASGSGTVMVQSTKDGVVEYDYTSYFGDEEHGEDSFDVYQYLKVEDGKLVSAY
ncbi:MULTISPECIES: hypothetical protein [unclassified Curtobacterium]|uniref:hypothetical protein n=1 Tax=unclassified Curtobacterium TaxID=257496 RepID=UPI000F486205|nr:MULTISPECIES: hypothetical protein [unclassified Curtobacterium]ROQ06815.1 hypothetical protein EDF41_2069 [Curtobacterium sp. PhB171]ROQ27742.1 hypothetical protein EDF40_0862 [Curtobacterium sp. PhB170]ROS34670.1 hypothetical protein EDF25_1893 [Curtobacterium sp. PhB131]ROS72962.1 hypothetical protein EDF30_0902 [Curtobacterium sp. PhB141]